jgi:nucleoside-diphosphate-sugar epimerase
VDLARDHHIIAIDRREPALSLCEAAPTARWEIRDISDQTALLDTLGAAKAEFGRIDFVLHFAAFYHFGTDWQKEYQSTNIDGTANVLSAARQVGVSRLIFASSIAAMAPPCAGFRTHG